MGHREGSPEREVHSNTGLPKKNRNISNKQLNTTPTRTEGTTTKTTQRRLEDRNNQDQSSCLLYTSDAADDPRVV